MKPKCIDGRGESMLVKLVNLGIRTQRSVGLITDTIKFSVENSRPGS